MDITDLPAHELSLAIRSRRISCREVMLATLARIARWNPTYNAIVSLRDGDELLREAAGCDARLARPDARPAQFGWLYGMPQAIKDMALTTGLRTTFGSPLMRDFVPAEDGLMVQRMKAAGCIVSLQEHLSEAQELVRTLKEPTQGDPAQAKRREQAAKLRAAEDREDRIRRALKQLPEVAATKKRNGGKEEDARASTTDPDARVMKMGDGGFRPAVNVQFATTCRDLVIVGMDVVSIGSDMAQLTPMVEQVHQRTGQDPQQWLAAGGFTAHEQIEAVAARAQVYAPVPEPRLKKDEQGQSIPCDKHEPRPGDSPAAVEWRKRMASDDAAKLYRQRAATAECVNAHARNRGLLRMPVRGLVKIKSVVGLFVLAHNLLRTAVLAGHAA